MSTRDYIIILSWKIESHEFKWMPYHLGLVIRSETKNNFPKCTHRSIYLYTIQLKWRLQRLAGAKC